MSAARKLRRRPASLVLCARVGETGNVPIPPGTLTADCSVCHAAVWVSAAVRELARATGTTPHYVCSGCMPVRGK